MRIGKTCAGDVDTSCEYTSEPAHAVSFQTFKRGKGLTLWSLERLRASDHGETRQTSRDSGTRLAWGFGLQCRGDRPSARAKSRRAEVPPLNFRATSRQRHRRDGPK